MAGDFWQDFAASASAFASAALPVAFTLASLCLGPIVVFGSPPFLQWCGTQLKKLGWIKEGS